MIETQKQLGKIEKVSFGFGGYQESMFGVSFTFAFDGCGVGDFISGGWCRNIKITKNTKWTEEERSQQRVDMCNRLEKIMSDAKVNDVYKLVGKPVEIIMDGMVMKSWRILTEVL